MQWNELTESKLIDINKENGCNEKDEDVLEEVTLVKIFRLRELSAIFSVIKRAKDKMLGADPNLKKEYDTSSRHSFCVICCMTGRRQILFRPLLMLSFSLQKIKHFNSFSV